MSDGEPCKGRTQRTQRAGRGQKTYTGASADAHLGARGARGEKVQPLGGDSFRSNLGSKTRASSEDPRAQQRRSRVSGVFARGEMRKDKQTDALLQNLVDLDDEELERKAIRHSTDSADGDGTATGTGGVPRFAPCLLDNEVHDIIHRRDSECVTASQRNFARILQKQRRE